MNFGARLQQALNEQGISQSELGRRVGATSQSVNGWCQSGILPRKEILEQLPQATGKPLYWFFMSDSDERMAPGLKNVSYDAEKQQRLLDVFHQLPAEEQERFIELIESRLKELDNFIAEYLKKRKIEPTAGKS